MSDSGSSYRKIATLGIAAALVLVLGFSGGTTLALLSDTEPFATDQPYSIQAAGNMPSSDPGGGPSDGVANANAEGEDGGPDGKDVVVFGTSAMAMVSRTKRRRFGRSLEPVGTDGVTPSREGDVVASMNESSATSARQSTDDLDHERR